MKGYAGTIGAMWQIGSAAVLALGLSAGNAHADKVTVNWATIGGFYTDLAQKLADKFEAKSGIKVNIINIDFAQLYEKQILEMVGETGAYDVITYASQWKPEFVSAGWLLPLDQYMAKSDPKELALDDIAPALVEISNKWQGKTYGLPYYTFTMGYFYRQDLMNDPTEKAAFKSKYGYDLATPTDYKQMGDIAEFFRRKPGDTLKGKPLAKDFYGIGVMAGPYTHIVDEIAFSLAGAAGANIVNDDGTPGVTSPAFEGAVETYIKRLLPNAPPGARTSAYDEVVAQMRQGLIAQTGPFYLDQWPNMVKAEEEVPGAVIAAAPPPKSVTLVGAFNLGVSKNSAHPLEAYKWIEYLAGPEAQREFALGGGSTARMSILRDKDLQQAHRATMGHFPTLLLVLEQTEKAKNYPNIYYVAQSGKIYEELKTALSSAVSGQKSVDDAMQGLAEAIKKHCNGPCKIQK